MFNKLAFFHVNAAAVAMQKSSGMLIRTEERNPANLSVEMLWKRIICIFNPSPQKKSIHLEKLKWEFISENYNMRKQKRLFHKDYSDNPAHGRRSEEEERKNIALWNTCIWRGHEELLLKLS